MTDQERRSGGLLVLIPIYNDWAAVELLFAGLGRVLADAGLVADVLLVDDGSTTAPPSEWSVAGSGGLGRIDVLTLRRNLGHQRAIAIALAYVDSRLAPAVVVVMDGDGEDAPEDVPRLLACLRENHGAAVVFAERTKRSESLTFRFFYFLYRWVHLLLTGIPVRVGNFSAIPASLLRRLVVVSELWNHYAAAVFTARVPRASVPTVRAQRLEGASRMKLVGLVTHGLSALSVHSELIGVRLLVVSAVIATVMTGGLLVVLAIRLFTALAIPGWASTIAGLLLVLLFQSMAFAAFFVFLVLHGRSQPAFVPIRDYVHFVDSPPPHVTTVAQGQQKEWGG